VAARPLALVRKLAALQPGNEVPERCNIGSLDWTLEVWFKASGEQSGRGVLFELRNETGDAFRYNPAGVNALALDEGRRGFVLQSRLLTLRSGTSRPRSRPMPPS